MKIKLSSKGCTHLYGFLLSKPDYITSIDVLKMKIFLKKNRKKRQKFAKISREGIEKKIPDKNSGKTKNIVHKKKKKKKFQKKIEKIIKISRTGIEKKNSEKNEKNGVKFPEKNRAKF